MSQPVVGPDGKTYMFPDGTTREQVIAYFRKGSVANTRFRGVPEFAKNVGRVLGPEGALAPLGNLAHGFGISEAVTAPPTEEERKQLGIKGEPNAMEKWALANSRMLFDPINKAVQWYRLAGQGKIPGAYESWLSAGPEGVGQALGNYYMMKGLMGTPGTLRNAKEGLTATAQDAAGAGREPVSLERIATEKRNQAAIEAAREHYAKELEKWQSGEEKNAEKVAEARRDLLKKTQEVERNRQEAAGRPQEKRGAERRVREYAEDFQKNAQRAHTQVRKGLDARWGQFRSAMKDATIPKTELFNTIKQAQENLRGSPADLTVFRNMMKEMGVEVDEHGEVTAWGDKGTDLPVDTARVHSTAIGEKLAAGGLPGNVFQALRMAKEGVENQIEAAADQHGQGDVYRGLKRDWSTYMSDWRDSSSPLAQVVKANNLSAVEKVMTGEATRNNLSQLAAKYQGMGKTGSGVGGLSPSTVTAAGRLSQNISDITATRKAAGARQGMMLQSESPRLAYERANMPKMEGTPPPAEAPAALESVDPAEVRRRLLLQFAGRPYRPTDIFPSHGITHLALQKMPGFLEWLANQPRKELATPELPGPSLSAGAIQNQIWTNVVENLRMKLEREKAAGSSQQYLTRMKLLDAEDKLKSTFGSEQYAKSPQAMSKEGGGGANYTAGDLDALKKKYPDFFKGGGGEKQ